MNVYGEAVIVGVICMLVGLIVFVAVAKLSPLHFSKNTGTEEKTKKSNTSAWLMQLLLSLFLTGFLGHLFFEFTGMNKRLYRWTGVWLW